LFSMNVASIRFLSYPERGEGTSHEKT
jgi:hypothetical protein